MEQFKTIPAYFMAIYLLLQKKIDNPYAEKNYHYNLKRSRRHFSNSFNGSEVLG